MMITSEMGYLKLPTKRINKVQTGYYEGAVVAIACKGQQHAICML